MKMSTRVKRLRRKIARLTGGQIAEEAARRTEYSKLMRARIFNSTGMIRTENGTEAIPKRAQRFPPQNVTALGTRGDGLKNGIEKQPRWVIMNTPIVGYT